MMSDESVVKYDERGVMDGGTIGLPREMTRSQSVHSRGRNRGEL